jgi:hypothetical protein
VSISDFIERCDRYSDLHKVSRTWLSKKLFNDTYAIEHVATGQRDMGVKRLQRATADLAKLEAEAGRAEAA